MRNAITLPAFAAAIFVTSGVALPQGKVSPALRERLDRQFASARPQPGDYLPTIELMQLDDDDKPELKLTSEEELEQEPQTTLLRYATRGDACLMITASLTCPKTRKHFPALQQIKRKYGDRLGVAVVYVVEAHPEHDICPYLGVVDITDANLRDNIRFRQPTTMAARVEVAKGFAKRYPINGAFLVDSMDNIAWRSLGKSPNMALLADGDGRVVYRQGWVEPESLDLEIDKLLKSTPKTYGMGPGMMAAYTDDEDRLPGEAVGNDVTGRMPSAVEDQGPSQALTDITKRLSPNGPSVWSFVRWLEKVNDDKLRLLLKRYPTVINEKLTYGAHDHLNTTILEIMIARADLAKVKIVVGAGADLNLATEDATPLNAAIKAGSLEIVDFLISSGANVRQTRQRTKVNAVHDALLQRKPDIAKRLVQAGLPLDIFSRCGLGLLDAVVKELDEESSSGLLFDEDGNIPLSFAIANNHPEVVQLLLARDMVYDAGKPNSQSPVEMAVGNPDTAILTMLLGHGLSPDSHWGAPLLAALDEDKYEHFKCLMAAKVSIKISTDGRVRRGRTPLHLSIDRMLPTKFAADLLDYGADIDALTTDYDDDGCGPESPRSSQETALHLAARQLLPEHAAFLLARNAKPDELDQSGLSPLAVAILCTLRADADKVDRGLATIKALAKGGCSLKVKDSQLADVRDTIADVLSKPTAKAPESPVGWRLAFEVEPKRYSGPVGFDATKLSPSPVLTNIQKLLHLCENTQ